MENKQLYLKPEEGKFLSMAVVRMIEDLKETSQNQIINWAPDARKQLKEMLTAGESLRQKLVKLGFDMRELPPYIDGDENEFLTKQS